MFYRRGCKSGILHIKDMDLNIIPKSMSPPPLFQAVTLVRHLPAVGVRTMTCSLYTSGGQTKAQGQPCLCGFVLSVIVFAPQGRVGQL